MNVKKKFVVFVATGLISFPSCLSQKQLTGNRENNRAVSPATAIHLFKSQDVKLLPGLFKEAETTDLDYILALDPDRLLAPYLREAGLAPKAASYTNWENTGLDGHIGGHYLSALAMMLAETGNEEVQRRLYYMISELKKCQDAYGDGYLGGVPGSKALWKAVFEGNVEAIRKKWVPFYNIHKVYAGLRDAYLFTGNTTAKDMLIKFSDWFVRLVQALSPEKMESMLDTEYGGINEVLADVFALTGEKKYLEAARRFSHKAILLPLEKQEDRLNNLHANTQIPKVIGFKRIADLGNDNDYNRAAHFFWETVVNNRTVAIGGNSVREHFNPSNDFSSMITSEEGPESCNTYNMLKLTKLLFQSDGLVKYIDFYERALYNHILSTQLPERGGFVYFTPMRPGHYRVYSQPETSMWCCVGSGIENHTKYNEMIYGYDQDALYVNLFIPSALRWDQKGMQLTQTTDFPDGEKTVLTIDKPGNTSVAINIRYPSWVSKGAMKIWVNKKEVPVEVPPSSYFSIKRKWKKGDRIEIYLPMHTVAEQLPDGSPYYALVHGPIVLAAKTGTDEMTGLFADNSRFGHIARGKKYPLDQEPVFVSDDNDIASRVKPVKGKVMTFRADDLIFPDQYRHLELIPFYKVNASRYIVYWQKETPSGLKKIQEELAVREAKASRLAGQTIDMVAPGEQQPESDHFMEMERSRQGVHRDRHWRDAEGWFSYKLNDPQKEAVILRVMYYGLDRNRHFSIFINNTRLADVLLEGKQGDTFFTVDYSVPPQVVQASGGELVVKFQATEGSVAGGIYEVRLLKK